MVATRGQTGSDGPATSTPSSAAPMRHTATLAPTSDAGAVGRSEGRTTSADLTGRATGGSLTMQAGSCAKATQADPATRSRLPWLPTDYETETEPEDMYSQGHRLDPNKDRWEKPWEQQYVGHDRLFPRRAPWSKNPIDVMKEQSTDADNTSMENQDHSDLGNQQITLVPVLQ